MDWDESTYILAGQALHENKHLKDGLNIDKKDVPNMLVREALDSLLN